MHLVKMQGRSIAERNGVDVGSRSVSKQSSPQTRTGVVTSKESSAGTSACRVSTHRVDGIANDTAVSVRGKQMLVTTISVANDCAGETLFVAGGLAV